MNDIPAQAAMGWDKRRRTTRERPRTRVRDMLPPIAAALVITLANLAFGAVQPIAALTLSAAITAVATAALAFAGPRSVTPGMVIGATLVAIAALTGLAGPLDRAAAPLAVLFAAGAMWTIGYIAAGRRSALAAAWSTLVWTSAAYCAWMFISSASPDAGRTGRLITDAFETPANAAVVFGLLSILGLARVLHVLKQVDADALLGFRMVDRLLRDALGGFLLLGLAVSCLVLAGSRAGILMTFGVMLGHMWWDTLSIMTRPHRGRLARVAVFAAPVLACALAALGMVDGWLNDETIAPGIGLSDTLPNLQRFDAYSSLWLEAPITGHGLGSLPVEGATVQTLANAKVMLSPGGAHNVFLTWLVETGLVGLTLLLLTLGAAYVRTLPPLASAHSPRTFVRLAFAVGGLLLLHGVTDSSLNVPSVTWLYAMILGVACGLARDQEGRDRKETNASGSEAD